MCAGIYGGMAARAAKGKPYFLFIQNSRVIWVDVYQNNKNRGSKKGTFILLYIYIERERERGASPPNFA